MTGNRFGKMPHCLKRSRNNVSCNQAAWDAAQPYLLPFVSGSTGRACTACNQRNTRSHACPVLRQLAMITSMQKTGQSKCCSPPWQHRLQRDHPSVLRSNAIKPLMRRQARLPDQNSIQQSSSLSNSSATTH